MREAMQALGGDPTRSIRSSRPNSSSTTRGGRRVGAGRVHPERGDRVPAQQRAVAVTALRPGRVAPVQGGPPGTGSAQVNIEYLPGVMTHNMSPTPTPAGTDSNNADGGARAAASRRRACWPESPCSSEGGRLTADRAASGATETGAQSPRCCEDGVSAVRRVTGGGRAGKGMEHVAEPTLPADLSAARHVDYLRLTGRRRITAPTVTHPGVQRPTARTCASRGTRVSLHRTVHASTGSCTSTAAAAAAGQRRKVA